MAVAVTRRNYREGRGGDEPRRQIVDPIGDLVEYSMIGRADDFAQFCNVGDDVL